MLVRLWDHGTGSLSGRCSDANAWNAGPEPGPRKLWFGLFCLWQEKWCAGAIDLWDLFDDLSLLHFWFGSPTLGWLALDPAPSLRSALIGSSCGPSGAPANEQPRLLIP